MSTAVRTMPRIRANHVTVVAHRGASAYAPENTLPALELGAAMGADYVEIDVQATIDGALVVMHDTTLTRTTDVAERFPGRAPWNVGDLTLAQIRTLDAGSWFGKEYAGTPVPTLREVLDAVRGRVGLLVEVKSPTLYPGIDVAIAAELDAERRLGTPRRAPAPVVQSFDRRFLTTFHAVAPQTPVGLLDGPPPGDELPQLAAWIAQVNPHHVHVTARAVEAIHARGLRTMPYTVDSPRRMRRLVDLGVDGMITNRPDVLLDVLRAARAA